MISLRLVRLIETEAADLSDSLLQKLHASQSTQGLRKVPERELHDRCLEVYSHLGDWLLHKSSIEVEHRFQDIGVLRARQNVPLSAVVWGLFLTKEHLWSFLEHQGFLLGAVELHGELELLRLLDHFFDRAIYNVAIGYEHGREPALPSAADAGQIQRRNDARATA